jgi:hypothetical protein
MASGTIIIKNPNGKSGIFKVITVDSGDECAGNICDGQELTFVDPQASSGVVQGSNAIGKIVQAGQSDVFVVINLRPN